MNFIQKNGNDKTMLSARIASRLRVIVIGAGISALVAGSAFASDVKEPDDYRLLKEIILIEFADEKPHEAGPVVPGVMTQIDSQEHIMALTFNVNANESVPLDTRLFDFLRKENIPAVFFVSGKWIEKNPEWIKRIGSDELFEIGSLGLEGKACTVTGENVPRELSAARSVEELFIEIEKNARKIESLTGALPRFIRSPSSYYDDVAVRMARAMGYEVIGSMMPDPHSENPPKPEEIFPARSGAIVAMTLEDSGIQAAIALRKAVPRLKSKGFRFVKLGDCSLR
ncbi:MAG: Peptidoglycan-N-acetylmuramic acid deacetylase PdaA precursor [Candidatus Omnitrophica bacterium ADurb.Bin292]|jgi:peptidoglycan/xylan/chitin deacetylase (PgdA/CDA1 family)|nr:MAG: Peptidoglycan-N-acetylmuramic acid deacetylase PdaA precursor [Candidatus Omnitrophica bacterium ADurb.Bin292]HQB11585.1 polysaccharide deacetylase family protein [Candidatus Omnitrophota bacterium]